ncbi:MAG: hypothetical protein IJ632_00530 [Muribaculaceae bacterium]|nr:hypothetical protein [Muribaculaceae bacterium]
MNLIYEKHTLFTFTITLSADQVLDIIYSESAWRAKHAPFVFLLTAEHRTMLLRRVGAAFADLRQRLGRYVEASNWNPELDDENVIFVLGLEHDPGAAFEAAMRDAVAQALAYHVLAAFYGDEDTCYGTAARRARARTILLLAPRG